jgi:hypothetical protein
MVLSVLGLFFGIMLRAKGPYRTEWTDVPIEQQLQDGEFRWPNGQAPRLLALDVRRIAHHYSFSAYRDMEGRSSVRRR